MTTFPPSRIQAAARAMARADVPEYDDDEFEAFWGASGHYRKAQVKAALAALTAAYPGLASGEAWVAPHEATVSMVEAADGEREWGRHTLSVYRVMREAYLTEQSDIAAALEALKEPEAGTLDEVLAEVGINKEKP